MTVNSCFTRAIRCLSLLKREILALHSPVINDLYSLAEGIATFPLNPMQVSGILSYSLTPPHRPGLWCQVFDRGYTLAEVMSGRLLCQRCVTIETGNVTLRTAGNPSKCPVTCTKLEFVTARGYGNAKKLCNL
ncbi:hypothetical protein PO909_013612 [Leuciscus waleckii]